MRVPNIQSPLRSEAARRSRSEGNYDGMTTNNGIEDDVPLLGLDPIELVDDVEAKVSPGAAIANTSLVTVIRRDGERWIDFQTRRLRQLINSMPAVLLLMYFTTVRHSMVSQQTLPCSANSSLLTCCPSPSPRRAMHG